MESSDVENIVYDHRLSSVVPASITGEDKVLNLTHADLAMKLHYLRGVYLFRSEAVEGLDVRDLKNPMFRLLESYYPAAGRIRKSPEDGRPFIKCNDSGVRIIEAKCSKTVDEWLALSDPSRRDQLLHHDQVLGPDLGFSPLVFMQFTRFKCGGLSVGFSWAHVIGDAFSVSDFFNNFGQAMAGRFLPKHLDMPSTKYYSPKTCDKKFPFSLGRVGPVGDHWKITNTCKMVTHSYCVTDRQLNKMIFKNSGLKDLAKIKPFEVISGMIWKSLAKVREESGSDSYSKLKTVTIVKNDFHDRDQELLSNGQVISVVKAELRVAEADVLELAQLIAEKAVDERGIIDEFMEEENGKSDFYVYGANLTFVNLEEMKFYEVDMKGQKPTYANYTIGGVGDEGAVLVLPLPENLKGKDRGRTVNVILPEHLHGELKNELSKEWGTF